MKTLYVLALALTLGPAAQAQTESVLHSFSGQPDGSIPSAGLVPDAQGNLYGTTYEGGASGGGTVFEVTPAGKETVLHSFTGGADGSGPASVLLRANGKLYGTTLVGGANSFGTVFELTSSAREAAVVSFTIEDGGGYPNAGVVQDTKGNLYGTDSGYNGGYGNGAVFKLTPTGVLTIIYTFTGGTDGLCPYGGLILDPEGNLYGTTYRGGASGEGTVFEITPDGTETVLYSFTGQGDGSLPAAGLLRDAEGIFTEQPWGAAKDTVRFSS